MVLTYEKNWTLCYLTMTFQVKVSQMLRKYFFQFHTPRKILHALIQFDSIVNNSTWQFTNKFTHTRLDGNGFGGLFWVQRKVTEREMLMFSLFIHVYGGSGWATIAWKLYFAMAFLRLWGILSFSLRYVLCPLFVAFHGVFRRSYFLANWPRIFADVFLG